MSAERDAIRTEMAHDCIAAIETARPLCDRDSHRRSAEYNQGLADGIARGLKIAVRAVRLVAESSSNTSAKP